MGMENVLSLGYGRMESLLYFNSQWKQNEVKHYFVQHRKVIDEGFFPLENELNTMFDRYYFVKRA